MDGVSSAASVLTVLGLSLQSIRVIYRVVSDVKDGQDAVQHTLQTLNSLESLLQQLIKLGTGFESDADLPVLVQNCAKDLRKFEIKVGKVRILPFDNKLSKAWTGFKITLRRNEVIQMRDVLQGHVGLLGFQLGILQTKLGVSHVHDLGDLRDTVTKSLLQASEESKAQLRTQSHSVDNLMNQQMQLSLQSSNELASSKSMLDQMQSTLRGIGATSSSLETNVCQLVDNIGHDLKSLRDASLEQKDVLKSLAQQLQHQFTKRTCTKGLSGQLQQVHDTAIDVEMEEQHNETISDNDSNGLHASLDRLFNLASEKQSTVFSVEAQSIIDDVEQLLNAISMKAIAQRASADARKRKVEELTERDETEDLEHKRRIRRIRGSLIASQCLALNKPVIVEQKRPENAMNMKKCIEDRGNKDHENGEHDELIEVFEGTIAFLSRSDYRNSMMSLSFQQKITYQGSYLRKPTIFFSAIVPEDSEVFSLVKKDALDDLLRLFAEGAAKYTDRDPEGRSLLKYACAYPAPKICKYLIEQGANVNGAERGFIYDDLDVWESSMSHTKAQELEASLACRRLLLESGADPTAEDQLFGANPWWGAISGEPEAISRLLLGEGREFIDLDAVNDRGDTAFLSAVKFHRGNPNFRFWDLLISHNTNINARNLMTEETCLHYILSNYVGDIETLIDLIKAGADVHAKDNSGRTVSEVAYRWRGRWPDSPSTPRSWESALTACGFDAEEFRRGFYSTLGPMINTYEYHVLWLSEEETFGISKVRNIYWVPKQDSEGGELDDEELESDELESNELESDEEQGDEELGDDESDDAEGVLRKTEGTQGKVMSSNDVSASSSPLNWDDTLRRSAPITTNPWDSSQQLPSFDTFISSLQLQDDYVVPPRQFETASHTFSGNWTSPGPSATSHALAFPDTFPPKNSSVSNATMNTGAIGYDFPNHDWALYDRNVWGEPC
ncbi:MAG: hypothetical protein Q9187_004526 [Circinaria calcarea]